MAARKVNKKSLSLQDIERDSFIESLFYELLPHYWDIIDDVPPEVKLKMVLSGYSSIPMACMDLPKRVLQPKVGKNMSSSLRKMQVWKEI